MHTCGARAQSLYVCICRHNPSATGARRSSRRPEPPVAEGYHRVCGRHGSRSTANSIHSPCNCTLPHALQPLSSPCTVPCCRRARSLQAEPLCCAEPLPVSWHIAHVDASGGEAGSTDALRHAALATEQPDEGDPKPDTSNTVTSRRLSAPAAARKHSHHAPRAACAPHRAASMSPETVLVASAMRTACAHSLQTSCLWRTGALLSARELIARRRRPRARRSRRTLT